MNKLFVALAGAAVLAACDPTDKNHYSCTVPVFEGVSDACIQVYLTEPEGNVAETQCDGTWEYHPCPGGETRVAGYCRVDDAADYSLSGTPAEVYFYAPVTSTEAQTACQEAGFVWMEAPAT